MIHTTDELIDATLTTLHNTPPPTGLEDRLLRSLEAAQQRTPASNQPRVWVPYVSLLRHGWTTDFLSQRLWAGTALAAAILAIVFAIHLHRMPTKQTKTPTFATVEVPTTASTPNNPVILSEAQRSRRTPTLSTDLNRPNLSASAAAIATSPPTPYELAALEDTLAPSQPAPPLPLTQQERLLLRCTRHSQPLQVAELDLAHQPEFQPAIAARDAARLPERLKDLIHSLVGYQPFDPPPPSDEAPPPPVPPDPVQQPTLSH